MKGKRHSTGLAVMLLAAYCLFLQTLFLSFLFATNPTPYKNVSFWNIAFCSNAGNTPEENFPSSHGDIPLCCATACSLANALHLEPLNSSHAIFIKANAFSVEIRTPEISVQRRNRGNPIYPQAPPLS